MSGYQNKNEEITNIKEKLAKIEEILTNISINSQLTAQLTVLLAKNQLLLMNNDENFKNSMNEILELLPDTMKSVIKKLSSIKEESKILTPEVSLQKEKTQEIDNKKSEILISPELVSFYQKEEDEIEDKFKRLPDYKDDWGFINDFRSTLETYEHLTHLLFSKFFYEIVVEIHHYKYEEKKLQNQINEITTKEFQNISLKLIKEAPTSQILQRLYRNRIVSKKISLEEEYNLLTNELSFIKEIVQDYYSVISKNLESSEYELHNYKARVSNLIKTFSLGDASLETRIILTIYSSSKQFWSQIDSTDESNRELMIIKLATLELILKSTKFLRKNTRFRELLIEMKT